MSHRVTAAAQVQLPQPNREEWNKNGTSQWLLSRAVKAVCYLPRLLLAVDLKLLHCLTPAVPVRVPTQHKIVRLVLAQALILQENYNPAATA